MSFLFRKSKGIKLRIDVEFESIDSLFAIVPDGSVLVVAWKRGRSHSGRTDPVLVKYGRAYPKTPISVECTMVKTATGGRYEPKYFEFDLISRPSETDPTETHVGKRTRIDLGASVTDVAHLSVPVKVKERQALVKLRVTRRTAGAAEPATPRVSVDSSALVAAAAAAALATASPQAVATATAASGPRPPTAVSGPSAPAVSPRSPAAAAADASHVGSVADSAAAAAAADDRTEADWSESIPAAPRPAAAGSAAGRRSGELATDAAAEARALLRRIAFLEEEAAEMQRLRPRLRLLERTSAFHAVLRAFVTDLGDPMAPALPDITSGLPVHKPPPPGGHLRPPEPGREPDGRGWADGVVRPSVPAPACAVVRCWAHWRFPVRAARPLVADAAEALLARAEASRTLSQASFWLLNAAHLLTWFRTVGAARRAELLGAAVDSDDEASVSAAAAAAAAVRSPEYSAVPTAGELLTRFRAAASAHPARRPDLSSAEEEEDSLAESDEEGDTVGALQAETDWALRTLDRVVQRVFRTIVRMVVLELEPLVRPVFLDPLKEQPPPPRAFADGDSSSSGDDLDRPRHRRPHHPTAAPVGIGVEPVLDRLQRTVDACTRARLPLFITRQIMIQVLHTLNALIFNGVAQRLQSCTSGAGLRLKFRVSQLVDWVRDCRAVNPASAGGAAAEEPLLPMGEVLLAHVIEVANFMSMNKTLVSELELRRDVCPSLNTFQLLHFASIYQPDKDFVEVVPPALVAELQGVTVTEAEHSRSLMPLLLDASFCQQLSVIGLEDAYSLLPTCPLPKERVVPGAPATALATAWARTVLHLPPSVRSRNELAFLREHHTYLDS